MFLARNNKGLESFHSSDPTYNRLYDRWDSIDKVNAPIGTFNMFNLELICTSYEINSYDSNNKPIIQSTRKVLF